MAGANPTSAADINVQVGAIMRQFVALQQQAARFQRFMSVTDLSAAPYSMGSAAGSDGAIVKSAVNDLNTGLQAVSMTFINQTTGLF